jgi:hypothetical protein
VSRSPESYRWNPKPPMSIAKFPAGTRMLRLPYTEATGAAAPTLASASSALQMTL